MCQPVLQASLGVHLHTFLTIEIFLFPSSGNVRYMNSNNISWNVYLCAVHVIFIVYRPFALAPQKNDRQK